MILNIWCKFHHCCSKNIATIINLYFVLSHTALFNIPGKNSSKFADSWALVWKIAFSYVTLAFCSEYIFCQCIISIIFGMDLPQIVGLNQILSYKQGMHERHRANQNPQCKRRQCNYSVCWKWERTLSIGVRMCWSTVTLCYSILDTDRIGCMTWRIFNAWHRPIHFTIP